MVNIVGSGEVNSTVSGSNTTYTAIPLYGYTFKKWTYNSTDYTDNPITIASTVADITLTFYYTIFNFLKGKVGFDIPDESLYSILLARGIDGATDINDLESEMKDLLYADVLIYGSTMPSTYGSIQDSDGGWTHQEGASTINAADKKRFETIANDIYKRYGDGNYKASIRIVQL